MAFSYVFQLLLKECTIEAGHYPADVGRPPEFQLLLKECTIEAKLPAVFSVKDLVSVVIERMYD